MKGMSKKDWEEGKSTRSGLLWEVERILKELKDSELPDIMVMENVPQVHGKKNIADFNSWLDYLSSRGYKSFWKDLNAKDFGIPQNRNRCFCVSIHTEKEVTFEFPKPIELTSVMKDYLEESVDEKYYVNNEKAKKLLLELEQNGVLSENREPMIIEETRVVGGLGEKKSNGGTQYFQQDRVYKGDIAVAIPSQLPGGANKYVIKETIKVKQATKKGYIECCIGGCYDSSYPESKLRRGRVQEGERDTNSD